MQILKRDQADLKKGVLSDHVWHLYEFRVRQAPRWNCDVLAKELDLHEPIVLPALE